VDTTIGEAADASLAVEAPERIEVEDGSVELRRSCIVVVPATGRSIGLEEARLLSKLKRERYGSRSVYLVYHNLNGVVADYAFMSRADRFCGENSIPLILVVDPSPRARMNIAIAHLLAKASSFKVEPSLEAALAYVEENPPR
jgi:hypothetical protein